MRDVTQGGTRAERKRHTRALIVRAARGFVADGGFASMALREVARAAGIVPTAFYRHFESLDDLAVEVTSEAVEQFRGVIAALEAEVTAPPWEVWPPVLADAGAEDPEMWAVFVRALVEGEHPAGRAAYEAGTEARRRLAIVLSRHPYFDDRSTGDVDVLADIVVAEVVRTLFAAGTAANAVAAGAPRSHGSHGSSGSVREARQRCAERLRLVCGGPAE